MTVKDALRLQLPASVVTALKTLLWLGGASLLAAGFDFKTPRQRFAEQDARIATTDAKAEAAVAGVNILLRLQCVDDRFSVRERQLARLDCPTILGPQVTQAGRP